MVFIERREVKRTDQLGRTRPHSRYKVRYRDQAGREHSETFDRKVDAERRKAEIKVELASGRWRDPRRGEISLADWTATWIKTRHDLRATTRARLETTLRCQVLPRFGGMPLIRIRNAAVRSWVSEMVDSGLSPATVRKAVFALRQALEAAIADYRLQTNPAQSVPLPAERAKPQRFLSRAEVERLIAEMPDQYRALVLVGAYAGLRWGEAVGLRRHSINVPRSRIAVTSTAVEVHGSVLLDQEPKTRRSVRTVPVARSAMSMLQDHLDRFVGPAPDALVFTGPSGNPLFRSFGRDVLQPAVARAGLQGITFHGLRHSFVAILVAAGCNVREVSEWAGHNSVAFTLTRYGGLFDDGTDQAIDRLDAVMNRASGVGDNVIQLPDRRLL